MTAIATFVVADFVEVSDLSNEDLVDLVLCPTLVMGATRDEAMRLAQESAQTEWFDCLFGPEDPVPAFDWQAPQDGGDLWKCWVEGYDEPIAIARIALG